MGRLFASFLLGLLGVAAHAADGPSDAAPPSLEALMHGMAGASGVEARFREVKRLALLSEPLESTGTLYFVPPSRLARVTRTPAVTRLVIDGDRFTFEDGTGAQALDLSGNPVAREVVANFVVLFNGDLEALRERYDPSFAADGERWSLVLAPRRAPLRDIVERVTLEGSGRALTRMELVETGGDTTVTRFEDVESDRVFDAAERARIFGGGEAGDAGAGEADAGDR